MEVVCRCWINSQLRFPYDFLGSLGREYGRLWTRWCEDGYGWWICAGCRAGIAVRTIE